MVQYEFDVILSLWQGGWFRGRKRKKEKEKEDKME
jgi:hypothetical protein